MTPSTALAPELDVNDLNFDTCERLRHLDWLLNQLCIGDDARVLDIGGYPCYMARAFPRRKIVTADMYAMGHPPYIKASGAALPFTDNTFDVTIACDVLEHVPPVHRKSFLSELARVSSRAVIVAGPYTTPGTAKAESMVRTLLPESSPAQMWLAEHAECGLPSIEETLQVFCGAGAAEARALPVGSLTEWILFFAAQAAGERHHQVSESMQSFIAHYNRLHTASGVSAQAPAYRHAVVAALDTEAKTFLEKLAVETKSGEFDHQQVDAYVDALGELLQSVFRGNPADDGLSGDKTGDDASRVSESITAEYINRLETMLSHRGIPLPQREDNMSQRLRRAWRVLRGE